MLSFTTVNGQMWGRRKSCGGPDSVDDRSSHGNSSSDPVDVRGRVPIPNDVSGLMLPGEQSVAAYKTFRDSAVFTTKRLTVRDPQGMIGRKVEVAGPE